MFIFIFIFIFIVINKNNKDIIVKFSVNFIIPECNGSNRINNCSIKDNVSIFFDNSICFE